MVWSDMVDWHKQYDLKGSISGLSIRSSYDLDQFRLLRAMNVTNSMASNALLAIILTISCHVSMLDDRKISSVSSSNHAASRIGTSQSLVVLLWIFEPADTLAMI